MLVFGWCVGLAVPFAVHVLVSSAGGYDERNAGWIARTLVQGPTPARHELLDAGHHCSGVVTVRGWRIDRDDILDGPQLELVYVEVVDEAEPFFCTFHPGTVQTIALV
jgi:hypothetical protein